MAFTTDAVVKQAVADVLEVAVGDLVTSWTNRVSRCHARAYSEILATMLGRGYSAAQVAAWDDGAVYEKELSLYFLFMAPQGQGVYDKEAVKEFDIRELLKTAPLLISGVIVDPAGVAGTVRTGEMDPSGDIFTGPWSGDETGEIPSRW